MALMHSKWRLRLTIEQVLIRTDTGDRPGNEPQEIVKHHETTVPLDSPRDGMAALKAIVKAMSKSA